MKMNEKSPVTDYVTGDFCIKTSEYMQPLFVHWLNYEVLCIFFLN